MSKFNLTLNRLHKVIERATILRDKAFTSLQEAFSAKGNMDYFDMKSNVLPKEMFKSGQMNAQVHQELEKATILNDLVVELKAALIRKNVQVGINEEVARLDGLNKMLGKLTLITHRESMRLTLSSSSTEVSIEDLSGTVKSILDVSGSYDHSDSSMNVLFSKSISFSYLTEETKNMIGNTITSLRIKIDQTNDRIAELNATRIEVDIDAAIAVELGLNPQD